MDEYSDIYYFDDTRNATRDHRAQGGAARPRAVHPSRTMAVQPVSGGSVRPVYAPQAPMVYAQQPITPMVYAQQPIMVGEPSPMAGTAGSLLGRLTIAELLEIAAHGFAALQPLPPAPNPTQDTNTNVANLIVYQRELAEHAKLDEKIRTLGVLVAKLAG